MMWRKIRGWFTGRNYTDAELHWALSWCFNGDANTTALNAETVLRKVDGALRDADRAQLRRFATERIDRSREMTSAVAKQICQRMRAMG